MPMTPREIVKLLEANGFEYVSSNGSHPSTGTRSQAKQPLFPSMRKTLNREPRKTF